MKEKTLSNPDDSETPSVEQVASDALFASSSYCGEGPNQGLIVPREPHDGEGYATLACGGTEVRISYTVLHMLCGQVSTGHTGDFQVTDTKRLLKGLHAITCEAGNGHCGANAGRQLSGTEE